MEKHLNQYIDIWKKIVDVQQHFNDIEMRIRAIAIPTLAAMLGAAGFAHKEHVNISLFGASFSGAAAIALLTFVVWSVFYFLDRHWYHRLLYGAVNANIAIEKAIQTVIPELDLGGHISRESPIVIKRNGREILRLRSTHKMDLVYGVVAALILGIALVFALSGGAPASSIAPANS
jgi:hypothetical protein